MTPIPFFAGETPQGAGAEAFVHGSQRQHKDNSPSLRAELSERLHKPKNTGTGAS
jgi:hypothetical protein